MRIKPHLPQTCFTNKWKVQIITISDFFFILTVLILWVLYSTYFFLFFLTGLKTHRKITKVSYWNYYCYKLQIKQLNKSTLLHVGRLLQQYMVDMYIKLETSRLDFFVTNNMKFVLNYIKELLIVFMLLKHKVIK